MSFRFRKFLLTAIAAVAILLVLLCLAAFAGHRVWRTSPQAHRSALAERVNPAPMTREWGDSFEDGTPDFLRLSDSADRQVFRRWFTLIADYQAVRPRIDVPAEIADCAGLLRFCYREALKRHDDTWFLATGIDVPAPPGEICAWHYPDTPLRAGLFRVQPGRFEIGDVDNGAFAQFADAKTIVERNAFLLGRDIRLALPGDLLFYRQFGQSSPWHSMIVTRIGAESGVVYHTGPNHNRPGEIRRVLMAELLNHPDARWRPVGANSNFLGVYRWNILRGNP